MIFRDDRWQQPRVLVIYVPEYLSERRVQRPDRDRIVFHVVFAIPQVHGEVLRPVPQLALSEQPRPLVPVGTVDGEPFDADQVWVASGQSHRNVDGMVVPFLVVEADVTLTPEAEEYEALCRAMMKPLPSMSGVSAPRTTSLSRHSRGASSRTSTTSRSM